MTRIIAILSAIIICTSGCAFDEKDKPSATDMFYRAAGAYQSGDYDKAIELYQEIRSGGLESGAVYYNLGNAYLKKNDVGNALLNYTRAARYMPRDSDLIANERYARALMKQSDTYARSSPLIREILRLFNVINLNEALAIFFIIYYVFAALIILAAIRKKGRVLIIVFALIVAVFLSIAVIPVMDKIYFTERGAIAISSIIDVKKEPYAEASTGFPIYAGMNVYVLKEGLGWLKIQRPDGRIGWVPEKDIAILR